MYFVTWRLGAGQPPLAEGERALVMAAVRHFDGERYYLAACVIMDDHVHVLVQPAERLKLERITHSWKSYSANRLQLSFGRGGRIWQSESFDRIVRDHEEFDEKYRYIAKNPRKRWPDITSYESLYLPLGME
ncbi:MAG TPA: transposase [Armatimonadota bacterium]|nr:transposase [Armatimonadota bacterium]